jgi:hypothetical protein
MSSPIESSTCRSHRRAGPSVIHSWTCSLIRPRGILGIIFFGATHPRVTSAVVGLEILHDFVTPAGFPRPRVRWWAVRWRDERQHTLGEFTTAVLAVGYSRVLFAHFHPSIGSTSRPALLAELRLLALPPSSRGYFGFRPDLRTFIQTTMATTRITSRATSLISQILQVGATPPIHEAHFTAGFLCYRSFRHHALVTLHAAARQQPRLISHWAVAAAGTDPTG